MQFWYPLPRGGIRDQPHGDDFIRLDLEVNLVSFCIQQILCLFQQIDYFHPFQEEGGGESDTSAFSLAFVQADDESVAVFGLLHGFDDDIG